MFGRAQFNLDKLSDYFAKTHQGNPDGVLGDLYVANTAAGYFATLGQQARKKIETDYAKAVVKTIADAEAKGVKITMPLANTDRLVLAVEAKAGESKLDTKLLVQLIREEFKCSEVRAQAVVDRAKTNPVKKSFIITKVG